VFAQADTNFGFCWQQGLVNIESLADAENALVLCGNCHDNYDTQWRPALIAAPTHLGFFARAEQSIQDGNESKRVPPTSVTYAEYCRSLDPTVNVEDGGRYTFYMQTAFKGDGIQPGDNRVRQWTGDPMAMLYRAMSAAKQILEPSDVTETVLEELRALDELYRRGNRLLAARARAAVQGDGPDAGHDGQAQQDSTGAAPAPPPPPPAPPAPPQDAAPPRNNPSTQHANSRAANGIPSPPSSLLASPDKHRPQKRKHSENELEPELSHSRKRTKVEAGDTSTEATGLEYIWKLFLQSTDTDITDDASTDTTPSAATEVDASLHSTAIDRSMDSDDMVDKKCWRWEGKTAQDVIGYWRRNFLPLYTPGNDEVAGHE
jgi:hypothetical protein